MGPDSHPFRLAREAAGLTRQELARSLGLPAALLRDYELRRRRVKATTIERLWNGLKYQLGVSPTRRPGNSPRPPARRRAAGRSKAGGQQSRARLPRRSPAKAGR